MGFPVVRPRRLRKNETIRRMVRETRLSPDQLIQPYFVIHGKGQRRPVRSMPGIFQYSVDQLVNEAKETFKVGIPALLLFGIPRHKDDQASEAHDPDGIIQRAVKELKSRVPGLVVMTDVCLCGYMTHGHCGVIKAADKAPSASLRSSEDPRRTTQVRLRSPSSRASHLELSQLPLIDNDLSLELLARTAVSHAEAGADIVAPSAMMDGQVRAIRSSLDQAGHPETILMSYAVKYASAFYGPFREAAASPPQFGDRKSYQMDPANIREAIREARLDQEEGADILMVKPAGPYLDVIAAVRCAINLPIAAYQVSGEYAMMKAAGEKGWLDWDSILIESLIAIRRAGADLIISYGASEAARSLSE